MCCLDELSPNKENKLNGEDLIDIDNKINNFTRLYNENVNQNDNGLVENDIVELLDYNKTIIENIEKRQDLIAKAQNTYNILQSNLSYLKSQNLELEKQIELISIEKEKDVQDIRNEILEFEKNKNNQIEKLTEEIELLQEEKSNRIKELENELLSVRQSHDDQIKFLNSNLENFKLEKENEINNLHKEIETIQAENEKDRKVLDEFQNMIRILEKIKGIFKKDLKSDY